MSYEISQAELYKGKGQPRLTEAINSLYMEPERGIRRLKEYSSLFTGVINVTIVYTITTVLRILALLFIVAVVMPETGVGVFSALLDVRNIFSFFIVTVIYYGISIVGWLFSSFIYFLPAKLLGGKGTFAQQAFMLSYLMIALLPLGIFSALLAVIPTFGLFTALVVSIVIFFYSTFLIFLTIREINEFSTLKAIISLLISTGIFIFLSLLLSLVLVLIFALPFIGNLPLPSV